MNVNDVVSQVVNPGADRLRLIFARQHELATKYRAIEERAGVGYGLLRGNPWNMHEQRSQEVCKNYAWRVVEEIAEACEAYAEIRVDSTGTGHVHAHEEIADGLHFLVELYLLVGITPDDLTEGFHSDDDLLARAWRNCDILPDNDYVEGAFTVLLKLGLAMNCLKCKPWKQTHVLTDAVKFRGLLVGAFAAYLVLAATMGMTDETLFDFYFRKSRVNDFRIRSQY